jgi:hypothetical protein
MALSQRYKEILARIPHLPNSAKVPVPVAAAHEGVSAKTILRNYPLVTITAHRKGVTELFAAAPASRAISRINQRPRWLARPRLR